MLPELHLWQDVIPRPGPMNMALDEVLLRLVREPWLRCYSWSEPSVSIGFSQDLERVAAQAPPHPVVRRWTGGGVVVHDGDWTYTLVVPRGHPFCDVRPVETYRLIHEALIAALDDAGITGGGLQPVSMSEGRGVCFVEPAQFDVVRGPDKLAGAAQRRSKIGFLHQGSVQNVRLPTDFGPKFASHLAGRVTHVPQADAVALALDEAVALAAVRYGSGSWLHHRRDHEDANATAPMKAPV